MSNQEQLDGKTVSANKHLVDMMIEKWDAHEKEKNKHLVDLMIEKWDAHEKEKKVVVKKVHLDTLDDLVSVNSLFTVAVFVGLSAATRGKDSLEHRDECNAGAQVRKMLIVYEVLAFAFFLLSSIVAKLIKLHLRLHGSDYKFFSEKIDLKDIMLIVAAFASAAGIVLLTLSVVNVVQIRIGLFSCGSSETRAVVIALSLIVGSALVIYVVSMAIAIHASMRSDKHASVRSDLAVSPT